MIIDLLPSKKLNRIQQNNMRLYEVDGDYFYSVTTMLSKTKDSKHLDNWKKRVGEETANKISQEALHKGTSLHNLVENALLEKELSFSSDSEEERFNEVFQFLSKEISLLKGLELYLFSKSLKLAGTCDLLYQNQEGEIVLGDLKTSKKTKKKEWLLDYFHQITAYSLMVYECYQIPITKGKIIISLENNSLQIEEFNILHYLDSFQTRLLQFNQTQRNVNASL